MPPVAPYSIWPFGVIALLRQVSPGTERVTAHVASTRTPSRGHPAAAARHPLESPTVLLSETQPPNMCIKVVHMYRCGHQLIETAKCANCKGGTCRGINEKVVPHADKCDRCCGGWYDDECSRIINIRQPPVYTTQLSLRRRTYRYTVKNISRNTHPESWDALSYGEALEVIAKTARGPLEWPEDGE
ncbi:MAG: hypothetical protein FRX48_01486 [Lasallia pustulata]|uniref:Uncharacterized protein n=1 Tax=Lasallia pustulata TaxID=136370 RepID=A0A1W5CZG0_9LECA|nr:MAG: hypothetical protein FRX48_01486 [Lasallia pustulata]SLM36135.1 hypothetical protein LPUS_05579 [Lasallia pustulata]